MGRDRPALGTPFGVDGPWLAAILDVLGDVHDLLDARLPQPVEVVGMERAAEPAPPVKPVGAVPISEPAPVVPPAGEGEEDDVEGGPVEVAEPAPAATPTAPPRRGKGSGLGAWRAFADLSEVGYGDDATRDDIIAACVKAEVIDPD